VASLEVVIEKGPVSPMMYQHILDIVDGRDQLVQCPCHLKDSILPPPLIKVDVPLDYQEPPAKFSSFRVLKANERAFEICKGWAEAFVLGRAYPAPLLCGPVGTGKTRLLWTILSEVAEKLTTRNVALYRAEEAKAEAQEDVETRPPYRRFSYRHITLPTFAEAVRVRAFNHSDVVDYRNELCSPDILVLDDIGAENSTDLVREQFYLLVEHRVTKRLPVFVACNFSSQELGTWLGVRIKSRLEGVCDIVEVHGTDMRAKEKERRLRKV
jgi:DNA replication protein DnaC